MLCFARHAVALATVALFGFTGQALAAEPVTLKFATQNTENAWTTIEWTNDAGDRTVTLHNYTLTYTRVKRSIFNITLEQGVATKGGVNLQVETEDVLDEEAQSFHGTIPVAAE